jgi:hypothetical protein
MLSFRLGTVHVDVLRWRIKYVGRTNVQVTNAEVLTKINNEEGTKDKRMTMTVLRVITDVRTLTRRIIIYSSLN